MAEEIEVYGDDDGIMLLGDSEDIQQALAELQISEEHTTDISKAAILKTAHRATKMFGKAQERSGRWVKLTKESAQKAREHGLLRNNATGNFMGVIGKGGKGGIKGNVQFERIAGGFNPAKVANVEMLMLTMALEQAMKEMTDYRRTPSLPNSSASPDWWRKPRTNCPTSAPFRMPHGTNWATAPRQ